MAAHHSEKTALPHRSTDTASLTDDEAVPDASPSDTAGLLQERLQAWKHACGYLENYITATEKVEKAHAKEYEKILKTISDPLREGQHFDQSLGGIAGLFENMRSNTQGMANAHLETAKHLNGSVLPILTRLHAEIKNKNKELSTGAVKGAKGVAAARNDTQKYIEALGQHCAASDSSGGKIEPHHDPYLVHREIQYWLHRQLLEENNSRNDLIAVQENFQTFESHVVQTIQQAMSAFLQYVGGQADRRKAMYSDITATAQRIPLDFEWTNFLHRNGNMMIDPSAPKRTMSNITYPNQKHPSTQSLISGILERKSRALGGLAGYKSAYYAVSPSKYLHQLEDDDNFRKEPTPELSLYLPDCTIGALVDDKFSIKGKDMSKGKIGSAFHMSHELTFMAPSPAEAQKWYAIISEAAGAKNITTEVPSPVSTSHPSGPPLYAEKGAPPLQTQGLAQGQDQASAEPQSTLSTKEPPSAGPYSAGPHSASGPYRAGGPHSAGAGPSSITAQDFATGAGKETAP